MIISIHQPNFFPWMGFFDKLNKSDKFVFLTASVRSKNDKYLTRARILSHSKPRYISVPLGIKQIPINQLLMPENNHWKIKALNIIRESYRKQNYYEEVYTYIEDLFMYEFEYYSDYSINIIKSIITKLNIVTDIYIDVDFNEELGCSNQRNISICKILDGDIYLSGDGAKAYNNNELYKENSIELTYQNYSIPKYNQSSSQFLSGLSIIDALFNCGFKETEILLKKS
jgi:hypothetical protein